MTNGTQKLRAAMRALALATIFMLPVTGHAGPRRVLTAIPRAMGRATVTMFTARDADGRRDVSAFLDLWLAQAATNLDALSTVQALHAEPGAKELNPFMYGRPSPGRVFVTMNVIGLFQGAMIQYHHELCRDEKCYTMEHWAAWAWTGAHIGAAIYNWNTERK